MVTTAYDIGDARRLSIAFTNLAGAAADPTAVTFTMREPDGTETAYVYGANAELVKSGTGAYYVDWAIGQAGRHVYRWVGTGTVAAAESAEFWARRTNQAAG